MCMTCLLDIKFIRKKEEEEHTNHKRKMLTIWDALGIMYITITDTQHA